MYGVGCLLWVGSGGFVVPQQEGAQRYLHPAGDALQYGRHETMAHAR